VLDCILDNVEGVQGMGETVVGLSEDLDALGAGQRGEQVGSFWRRVRRRIQHRKGEGSWPATIDAYTDQAHPSRFLYTLFSDVSDEYVQRTLRSVKDVYETVRDVSGAEVVIDSSKEVTRGLLLARHLDGCHLIHLVRNPLSVLASNLRKMETKGEFRFLRRSWDSDGKELFFVLLTCVNWMVGNLLCEALKRHTDEVTTIRLEDLKEAPAETLRIIGGQIGVDVEDVVRKVENGIPMSTGVGLRGNRMRRSSTEFVFDPSDSIRELPVSYGVLCRAITSPLRVLYGY
jgi:hypothetical protein